MNSIGGYLIIEDINCVDPIDNPERTWVDVILDWNPCNNLSRPKTIFVPSQTLQYVGNYMVGHPVTIRALQDAIKQEN